MNLASCSNCGNVIDLSKVKFIDTEIPDDPNDDERDEDGYFVTNETSYNPDLIWGDDYAPLDTWQCRVCKEFNGKGEE